MLPPFSLPPRLWPAAGLLALAGCGGDGTPTQPPPGVPGVDRLYTDEELRTPASPDAPPENPEWTAWVEANHHPIRSLTSEDFSDLQFLKPLLAGKRIVQLGESGHGVSEFNHAKERLIRFLHEEMDFDVVAFESSIYECHRADDRVATASAEATMRSCIFGVWHTREVLPLFEYLRETRGSGDPLVLAGFDTQVSSARGVEDRPWVLSELVARVDPAYARRVLEVDSTLLAAHQQGFGAVSAYARLNEAALVAAYDSVADFLERHRAELARPGDPDPRLPLVARQTARSVARYVRQLAEIDAPEASAIRDRGMADNVTFLLEELYPDEKIVVWAHNAHIRHAGASSSYGGVYSMGTGVAERHRPELYSIGLYMYTGQAAWNSREVYAISPSVPAGSLESILYRARTRWSFVDMANAPDVPGTSWMRRRIPSREWGALENLMVPADQYDGILFVHSTAPPVYLTPF